MSWENNRCKAVVGACHPSYLGKVVEVTAVYQATLDGKMAWWYEEKHYSPHFYDGDNLTYGGGLLGGVEPAHDCEIDTF